MRKDQGLNSTYNGSHREDSRLRLLCSFYHNNSDGIFHYGQSLPCLLFSLCNLLLHQFVSCFSASCSFRSVQESFYNHAAIKREVFSSDIFLFIYWHRTIQDSPTESFYTRQFPPVVFVLKSLKLLSLCQSSSQWRL